jgi:hypothetical protein
MQIHITSPTLRPRLNMLSLAGAAVALACCWAFGFAQSPSGSEDIHRVDFRNFTYRPSCTNLSGEGKAEAIKVTKGTYNRPDPDNTIRFDIMTVVYGDLTGAGSDEAVVLTVCNTGGTGNFTEGFIYAMQSGKPRLITNVPGGDRADGGISGAKIENGLLKLDTYAAGPAGGACCPEFIDTTTYRLNKDKLAPVGGPVRRKYQSPASDAASQSPDRRIHFERGRTKAIVKGTTSSSTEYVLGARAGQMTAVSVTSAGNNANFMMTREDGEPLGSATPVTHWSGRLPSTGDYQIIVYSTGGVASYTLEVSVR